MVPFDDRLVWLEHDERHRRLRRRWPAASAPSEVLDDDRNRSRLAAMVGGGALLAYASTEVAWGLGSIVFLVASGAFIVAAASFALVSRVAPAHGRTRRPSGNVTSLHADVDRSGDSDQRRTEPERQGMCERSVQNELGAAAPNHRGRTRREHFRDADDRRR
jgi:hypothetical protein